MLFLVAGDCFMNSPRDRYARELSAAFKVFDLPVQGGDTEEYRQAVSELAAALVQDHPASAARPTPSGATSTMQL